MCDKNQYPLPCQNKIHRTGPKSKILPFRIAYTSAKDNTNKVTLIPYSLHTRLNSFKTGPTYFKLVGDNFKQNCTGYMRGL